MNERNTRRPIPWPPIIYTVGLLVFGLPLAAMTSGLLVWEPTSTLPTVITTVRGCDILRGVDQGRYFYVADCRPDRLSQRGVME